MNAQVSTDEDAAKRLYESDRQRGIANGGNPPTWDQVKRRFTALYAWYMAAAEHTENR